MMSEAKHASVMCGKFSPDDVLTFWYDTGCFGYQICYGRVVKVGAKKIKILFENGQMAWKYPHFFMDMVSTKELTDLRAEGLKI